jgi:hypothetical protein
MFQKWDEATTTCQEYMECSVSLVVSKMENMKRKYRTKCTYIIFAYFDMERIVTLSDNDLNMVYIYVDTI